MDGQYDAFRNMGKKPLIINLLGGPGVGKSMFRANIFAELKWNLINVEESPEFAKDLTWENNYSCLNNQIAIFGEQYRRLQRLEDNVDVIITDAPIIQGIYYDKTKNEHFEKLMLDLFNNYKNVTYVIKRNDETYQSEGRTQSLNAAKKIDNFIIDLLTKYTIPYKELPCKRESVNEIVCDVLNLLSKK